MPTSAPAARRGVRGKPFQVGNPGRPKGARNKTTFALEQLSDKAPAIIAKAAEKALEGEPVALKLCFQLIAGQRRERSVPIELPSINSASDAAAALSAVIAAVAAGQLSPAEGNEFQHLISATVDAFQRSDLERRVKWLEQRIGDKESDSADDTA